MPAVSTTVPDPSRRYRAVILDMDGVVTDTASVHALAWKQLFDEALPQITSTLQAPFDAVHDYLNYVDGKPRTGGIESFLASRGLQVPPGSPDDEPGVLTVHGLAAAKQGYFQAILERDGIALFGSTVELLRVLHARGVPLALVSSSKNATAMVRQADLEKYFGRIVDGNEAARLGLPGKPAPDMFVTAARDIGVEPAEAIVVEDAISGVQSARAGGFGLVIGLNREGAAERLAQAGADVVVGDLAELDVAALVAAPGE